MKVGYLIKWRGSLPNKRTTPFGIVTEVGEHLFTVFWGDGSHGQYSLGYARIRLEVLNAKR